MTRLFEHLLGQTIPGGCESCNAVQTVTRDPAEANLFRLEVGHDDGCPVYRRLRRDGRAG